MKELGIQCAAEGASVLGRSYLRLREKSALKAVLQARETDLTHITNT